LYFFKILKKLAILQVTWTPNLCLIQRRTNINKLGDQKINLYEKVVTFEGAEHFTVLDSVTSPILTKDIQKLCKNIVDHAAKLTKIRITKMTLHFKIDQYEHIWLLYTTGLQIYDSSVFSNLIHK